MSTENWIKEVDEVLKNEVAQRHSYFQLKYFLIGKEPTVQSKLWKCLGELKIRRESLASLELELVETKDKMELLDITIQKILIEKDEPNKYGTFHQKECDIKTRQIHRQKQAAEFNLTQLLERKKWLEEESIFFLETYKNFLKVEPLKHFDDFESQKLYWGEKLSQKLNLKMLTQNQLDTELIEMIVALPDDMPIKQQLLGTLKLRHENMTKQLKETLQHIEEDKNN